MTRIQLRISYEDNNFDKVLTMTIDPEYHTFTTVEDKLKELKKMIRKATKEHTGFGNTRLEILTVDMGGRETYKKQFLFEKYVNQQGLLEARERRYRKEFQTYEDNVVHSGDTINKVINEVMKVTTQDVHEMKDLILRNVG